jgi:NodT family efflux transporter outer membrane factor (OMF) lipoprotein
MLCRVPRLLAPISLAVLLSSCAVGPDYESPGAWWSPTSWFAGRPAPVLASATTAAPIDVTWWSVFADPELTTLQNRVASSNLDIRVMTIRLAQSRAQLGVAQADQFPTLQADGSYTRELVSQKGVLSLFGGSSGGSGGSFASNGNAASGLTGTVGGIPASSAGSGSKIPPFNLYQYGFDASWELDLWGRVRREVESSKADLQAAEDSRRDSLVTALAEVARDYIQLRGIQRNIQIARDNLDTATQSLHITQDRAAGGLTTDLDVANARAQVATTAAQLPNLQQQEAQMINALSLLLGQPPNSLTAELQTPKPIPPIPPTVPVGIPSELARRRPDIRQAEAQLHAATAEIGVAVADFYPKISLSGSAGLQALLAKNLGNWNALQYGFGPTVTLPLFEGGRLKSTLELRKQQQQEAALNYQRTVLQALHDVDNALTAYDAEQRRQAQLTAAVAANRQAIGLATQRYTQGLSNFLDVLQAQTGLLATEEQLTDSTTTMSTNLVALYKALGGGWQDTYPDTATAPQPPPTIVSTR